MPRPPRLHVPGGCYHVILRGNHREPLFDDRADRRILNAIVGDVLSRFSARAHAFCWMTNHLHLLLQISDAPLGKLMQRIAMRYSRLRHRALRTTGHLFERRYKAKLVDVDAYFLTLVRYIHLNPVKAHMVPQPSSYPWSSHRAYLGQEVIPWLTTELALSMFSSDPVRARALYQQFMLEPGDDDLDDESHPDDPRIMGSDRFINSIPLVPYKPRSTQSLESLASDICASHSLSLDTVRSRSSARVLTAVRLRILEHAIDQRVATLTEVARFLDRDPSTLCKLARTHSNRQRKIQ